MPLARHRPADHRWLNYTPLQRFHAFWVDEKGELDQDRSICGRAPFTGCALPPVVTDGGLGVKFTPKGPPRVVPTANLCCEFCLIVLR